MSYDRQHNAYYEKVCERNDAVQNYMRTTRRELGWAGERERGEKWHGIPVFMHTARRFSSHYAGASNCVVLLQRAPPDLERGVVAYGMF